MFDQTGCLQCSQKVVQCSLSLQFLLCNRPTFISLRAENLLLSYRFLIKILSSDSAYQFYVTCMQLSSTMSQSCQMFGNVPRTTRIRQRFVTSFSIHVGCWGSRYDVAVWNSHCDMIVSVLTSVGLRGSVVTLSLWQCCDIILMQSLCCKGSMCWSQHCTQHYLLLWPWRFCVYKAHIDEVMPLKPRGSGNYESPCRNK